MLQDINRAYFIDLNEIIVGRDRLLEAILAVLLSIEIA